MDKDGLRHVKAKSHKRKRRATPFKKQNKPDDAAAAGWGKSFQVDQGNPDWSGWEEPLPKSEYSKGWEHQTRVDRLRDVIPFWRDGVHAALEGREVPKMEELLDRIYSEDVWGMTAEAWGVKEENAWATGGGWNNNNGWDNVGGWDDVADQAANNDWKEASVRQDDGGWGNDNGWGNTADEGWGSGWKDDHAGWDTGRPQADIQQCVDEWALAGEVAKHGSDKTTKLQPEDVLHNEEGQNSFVDQIARLKRANGQKKELMHQFYSMPTHVKVQRIEEIARSLRDLR